jgi:hypothetical protein
MMLILLDDVEHWRGLTFRDALGVADDPASHYAEVGLTVEAGHGVSRSYTVTFAVMTL